MTTNTLFRPSATVSRIDLMESRLHRRCRCRGGPPPWLTPPSGWLTPLAGRPPPWLADPPLRVGWLGRSAFTLTLEAYLFFSTTCVGVRGVCNTQLQSPSQVETRGMTVFVFVVKWTECSVRKNSGSGATIPGAWYSVPRVRLGELSCCNRLQEAQQNPQCTVDFLPSVD